MNTRRNPHLVCFRRAPLHPAFAKPEVGAAILPAPDGWMKRRCAFVVPRELSDRPLIRQQSTLRVLAFLGCDPAPELALIRRSDYCMLAAIASDQHSVG